MNEATCHACAGQGYIQSFIYIEDNRLDTTDDTCSLCKGTGFYYVTIPAIDAD